MKTNARVLDSARAVARQVLEGSVNPNQGCALIAEICERNSWPSELTTFSALAHDQSGHEQFGLTSENTAPLILEECRKLLGSASQ
jgi:hypothetical protein